MHVCPLQESLTATNIYKVLGLTNGTGLRSGTYQQANTFIVTWAFQLEKKCEDSKNIDWDSLTYSEVVHELMHAFHEHHDVETEHDHEEEYFSPIDLELLMREIDAEYTPELDVDKELLCNQTEAFVSVL
jgi:hypothetical protein